MSSDTPSQPSASLSQPSTSPSSQPSASPSQPSASPSKRKAASPPDTPPDSPDTIDRKKSKIDDITATRQDSPRSVFLDSPRETSPSPSPSVSQLMSPPSPRSPPARLPARPGTSPLTPEHLETAFDVIRNTDRAGTGRLTEEHLETALSVLRNKKHPPRPKLHHSQGLDVGVGAASGMTQKERTRMHAATHLRLARELLVEEIRSKGIKRTTIPIGPPEDELATGPLSSPRPSLLPSPDLEKGDVKEEPRSPIPLKRSGFDFAQYGKGKGDVECSKEGDRNSSGVDMGGEPPWKRKADRLESRSNSLLDEVERAREERKGLLEDIARAREELEESSREEEEIERSSREKKIERSSGEEDEIERSSMEGEERLSEEEEQRLSVEQKAVVMWVAAWKKGRAEKEATAEAGGGSDDGRGGDGEGEGECRNEERVAETGKGKEKEKTDA
ncbi:MAG: hypothetical protein Q9169_002786 [Polycauliona sp. 2 TL-2023]